MTDPYGVHSRRDCEAWTEHEETINPEGDTEPPTDDRELDQVAEYQRALRELRLAEVSLGTCFDDGAPVLTPLEILERVHRARAALRDIVTLAQFVGRRP